jgi:hypothetical protein
MAGHFDFRHSESIKIGGWFNTTGRHQQITEFDNSGKGQSSVRHQIHGV